MLTFALNITFSTNIDPSHIKINAGNGTTIEQGVRMNQIYIIWDEVDFKQGDVFEQEICSLYNINPEQHHCIIDAQVGFTSWEFDRKLTTTDSDFDPTTQMFMYNSHVRYWCGRGRAFEDNNGDRNMQQDFYCEWTGQWYPRGDLLPCVCKFSHVILNQL